MLKFWVVALNQKNRLNYALVCDQAKCHFYELKKDRLAEKYLQVIRVDLQATINASCAVVLW